MDGGCTIIRCIPKLAPTREAVRSGLTTAAALTQHDNGSGVRVGGGDALGVCRLGWEVRSTKMAVA